MYAYHKIQMMFLSALIVANSEKVVRLYFSFNNIYVYAGIC